MQFQRPPSDSARDRRQETLRRLGQFGTVAILLGYSLFVGTQVGPQLTIRTLALLALPLVLLACLFAAWHFRLAVLLLPVAALVVPIDLPTGTESRVPISLALTFMLMAIWAISLGLRGWKLAPSPLNTPLLIFSSICVLSFFWGLAWRDPGLNDWSGRFLFVQIVALMTIVLSLCAALLTGNFVTTAGQLKCVMGVFVGVCCLMLLIAVLGITQNILTIRGLWALWLIATVYALLIAQPRLGWYWRVLLLLVLLLTFYQVLIKDALWVSGWLPGLVAIFAVTFLRSRKAFAVLVIAAALAYRTPAVNNYFNLVAQENVDEGALERISIWEQNWQVVRAHWLLGTGPAGYAIYYMTYYRDDARSTHNNYLDILAQFGFAGVAVWIWLALAGVWEGWRLSRRARPGFIRTLAIAATGGWAGAMASMFLGDWVLPFAYNQTITGFKYTVYSWIFLGTLISIRQVLSAHPELRLHQGAQV